MDDGISDYDRESAVDGANSVGGGGLGGGAPAYRDDFSEVEGSFITAMMTECGIQNWFEIWQITMRIIEI